MDLRQLQYFVAVATTGNVGRAAEEIGMTQSPLSRQIQALEAHLGLQLFERRKKRLYLTRAGREFLQDARHLLAIAEKTETRAKALSSGKAGALKIGYVEGAVHAEILPRVLRTFRRAVPSVSLELVSLRSREQMALLQSGELDIGFTYAPSPSGRGVQSRLVHEEAFILAYPDEMFPSGSPSGEDLNNTPFVALSEMASPDARKEFLAACSSAGFFPSIKCEAAEPSVALALVGAGLGVAIVQESLKRHASSTVSFTPVPGNFPSKLSVYLACRENQDVLVQSFLACLEVPPIQGRKENL